MKNKKSRILAGILAAASLASFSACGGDGDSSETTASSEATTTTEKTEWTGDNIEVTTAEDSFISDVDINGKTLEWMGFYDLNPTNDSPERSTAVAIFEDTYGAKINYNATTSDKQYDDLATAVLGGNPPDIFVYDTRAFPYDISKGMYQPIDSLVDWEDPMWAEMKETADMLTWKGEHYIAPLGYRFDDYQILMYNKNVVESLGVDDPYELYLEDKWDWDAFLNIMDEFKGGDPALYGMAGWWANALLYSSGDTLVDYDGSKFINNLYSEKIEKAQGVIKQMMDGEQVKLGWFDPSVVFVNGDVLFYGMGTWAYNAAQQSMPEDVIQIVPFPRDPDGDTYYMNKAIFAHMWVAGSENADCVKVWFDINRTINYEQQYLDVVKEKYLANNEGWTSEMYDLVFSYNDDEKFTPSFEYGTGVSDAMAGDTGYIRQLYESLVTLRDREPYESWEQAREEYTNIIDSEISVYNG